jgi:hypothetical protein
MRANAPLVLLAVLLAACPACGPSVHVRHVRSGPALEPKPAGTPIPVFFNQAPDRPFREIGQIRIRTQGTAATIDRVLEAAVAQARELGADAIIVDLRAHYTSLPVSVDASGRPNVPPTERLNARATAIVFATPSGG